MITLEFAGWFDWRRPQPTIIARMASPMPRANQCEATFAPRPDCKLTPPLVAHACTRCYPRRFHEASRTRHAGARLRSVGIADSEGTRGDPNVARTQGRFSSRLGRKPIAHGASRGTEP